MSTWFLDSELSTCSVLILAYFVIDYNQVNYIIFYVFLSTFVYIQTLWTFAHFTIQTLHFQPYLVVN